MLLGSGGEEKCAHVATPWLKRMNCRKRERKRLWTPRSRCL